MKKMIVSVLVLVLVSFVLSCASAPPATASGAMTDANMPPWMNDTPPSDEIWGVGVADNAQIQMRMTMADSRARQDVARQLQVLAQGMVTDYAREAGGINNTAALQFSESVTRQIAQATLTGVVRDQTWNSPDGRVLWMRVKMNKADAARIAADQVGRAIDSEEARFAEFKAMDALRMMDMQLQNTTTSPEPVRN